MTSLHSWRELAQTLGLEFVENRHEFTAVMYSQTYLDRGLILVHEEDWESGLMHIYGAGAGEPCKKLTPEEAFVLAEKLALSPEPQNITAQELFAKRRLREVLIGFNPLRDHEHLMNALQTPTETVQNGIYVLPSDLQEGDLIITNHEDVMVMRVVHTRDDGAVHQHTSVVLSGPILGMSLSVTGGTQGQLMVDREILTDRSNYEIYIRPRREHQD